MSVFRWRYTEACEGRACCGDCDECGYDDTPCRDCGKMEEEDE